jgi:cell division protein FtsW (lipid II flippase)
MRKLVLLIVQAWYIPEQQAAVNSRNSTKFKTLTMVLLMLLLMFCKKVSESIGLIF